MDEVVSGQASEDVARRGQELTASLQQLRGQPQPSTDSPATTVESTEGEQADPAPEPEASV